LEGRLTAATKLKGIEDFKAKDCKIPSIDCHTYGPLVFFNGIFNANDKKNNSTDYIEKLFSNFKEFEIENFKFHSEKQFVLDCNWKIIIENYLDGEYHIPYLHNRLSNQLNMNTYNNIILHEKFNMQTSKAGATKKDERIDDLGAKYIYCYPNVIFFLNFKVDGYINFLN
jgi:phenylpropionate dioxygenase-like ring-hydroxylating dioxygenase large terminal subunit